MKNQVKAILERTPLLNTIYAGVRRRRTRQGFNRWTEEDEQRLKFYRQFIGQVDPEHPPLVFDVGANLGNRTKIFLRLGAKVIAFEPQQKCAEYLRTVLKGAPRFELVTKALGDKPGHAEMLVSNAHVLSTLSQEWTEATRQSGRFSRYEWNGRQRVEIITLDSVIAKYGVPVFVKIDVEGFEYQVLSGLSQPVPYISIEFTAERIEDTYRCMDHLDALGRASFRISLGESMEFCHPEWLSAKDTRELLGQLIERDRLAWGDVYIRSEIPHTSH